ncbi:MAG: glutamate--tRNA ligase [Candidatus Omnitrophota bacterium]|nr:glutamate--tRNA ligase [Candidatus Omnitrophota bacterium]MBU2528607.1 glutamate--tRNA ligase [bacterium]MBU3929767.1 glutamate--tRNA ligase [bacterium]MBU4123209.1 glutamate--tRNA ligase [bacterium]
MNDIRVRFAPSPTGYFHIGSARTALYNWLYARGRGGKFILRIEDTDEARSTVPSVRSIIKGLKFMGIKWDEGPLIVKNEKGEDEMTSVGPCGPYFQAQRRNFYTQAVDTLLSAKRAYRCFCSQEELAAERKSQLESKGRGGYSGKCRDLSHAQISQLMAEGKEPVIRFRVEEGRTVSFHDGIRGDISVRSDEIGDFVIMRSGGLPIYNFACVVDDHMMKISDVIRGEDHISNTPKQIMLYEALGWEVPRFAHLTMILDIDGSRLSKRSGARSLLEYADEGFIREAIVNYLALLGWATKDSRNIFSPDELEREFSLSRCGQSAAIFDNDKLLWLNAQHIKNLSGADIRRRAAAVIKEAGMDKYPEERLTAAIEMEKEKIKKLTEIPEKIGFLFDSDFEDDADVKSRAADTVHIVAKLAKALESAEPFSGEKIEEQVRAFAKAEDIKTKDIFHPLRWALSGRSKGPSLFHMCAFLGKNEALKRIGGYVGRYGGSGGE